jgi:hypothetical protein
MTFGSRAARGAEVTQYRTWEWGTDPAGPTGDPRIDSNPFFQDRVREAVEHQLTTKGFVRSKLAGPPDLLVHYHVNFSKTVEVSSQGARTGSCSGDCGPEAYAYEQGTLVVEVIDAHMNVVVLARMVERQHGGNDRRSDTDGTRDRRGCRRNVQELPVGLKTPCYRQERRREATVQDQQQDGRHKSAGGRRLLGWAERLFVIVGVALLATCAWFVIDARLAQRAARQSLEIALPNVPTSASPAAATAAPAGLSVVVSGTPLAALSIPRVHLSAIVLEGSDARRSDAVRDIWRTPRCPGTPGMS